MKRGGGRNGVERRGWGLANGTIENMIEMLAVYSLKIALKSIAALKGSV